MLTTHNKSTNRTLLECICMAYLWVRHRPERWQSSLACICVMYIIYDMYTKYFQSSHFFPLPHPPTNKKKLNKFVFVGHKNAHNSQQLNKLKKMRGNKNMWNQSTLLITLTNPRSSHILGSNPKYTLCLWVGCVNFVIRAKHILRAQPCFEIVVVHK